MNNPEKQGNIRVHKTKKNKTKNTTQYALNISMRRHKYRKQDMNPPINNQREHRFYAESVTDITTLNVWRLEQEK
jgi:hypothetical protein